MRETTGPAPGTAPPEPPAPPGLPADAAPEPPAATGTPADAVPFDSSVRLPGRAVRRREAERPGAGGRLGSEGILESLEEKYLALSA
ncbi:hypothetical protein QFZ63_006990 [Streptomyces sp. B3I7]|uniref:hypothetical protein n=1 Tax=Streptomyces sp. B3I7 TaxID=3042269 RepID=UPI002788ED52|nr:hypothetical protein [Streptomyces sp. B3I7]MDQ0815276.1 hypothetical protein [Streptomyces sp. B3I7]